MFDGVGEMSRRGMVCSEDGAANPAAVRESTMHADGAHVQSRLRVRALLCFLCFVCALEEG